MEHRHLRFCYDTFMSTEQYEYRLINTWTTRCSTQKQCRRYYFGKARHSWLSSVIFKSFFAAFFLPDMFHGIVCYVYGISLPCRFFSMFPYIACLFISSAFILALLPQNQYYKIPFVMIHLYRCRAEHLFHLKTIYCLPIVWCFPL